MKLYRVGGAVRDQLLGRPPKDQDFVAVGSTEQQLLEAFPKAKKVGAAFPVYCVDGMGEIALARREKKTGPAHTDFSIEFGPEVMLEEDLSRRDLTINAIAQDITNDKLIDPFGGQKDIQDHTLRHISKAFSDDALRVYRVARFAAQLGFIVAPETQDLMKSIPSEGLEHISVERVCEEFRKAICGINPRTFFTILKDINKLHIHFEELANLCGVPAGPPEHHAEDDSFIHTMMVLDQAVSMGGNEIERITALLHDLGKAITPRSKWPKHYGHDVAGVPLVEALCERLKLPTDIREAAVLGCREHMKVHRFLELRPAKKVSMVVIAERSKLKSNGLALIGDADSLGRIPSCIGDGPKTLRQAAELIKGISAKSLGLPNESCQGAQVGEAIKRTRVEVMRRKLPQPK